LSQPEDLIHRPQCLPKPRLVRIQTLDSSQGLKKVEAERRFFQAAKEL
jgi:hypothetical protein